MRIKSLYTLPLRAPKGYPSAKNSGYRALALWVGALFLVSCAFPSGPEVAPTPTRPTLALVATFTPTPEGAAAAQEGSGGGATAPQAAPAAAQAQAAPQPAVTLAPTATLAPNVARFTVKSDLAVNVRSGPGTTFGVIGTTAKGAQFEISGKNQAGDWYEFDHSSGRKGWIYAPLVDVENPQLITLALNIPVAPTPLPPTNTPVPVVVAPADPCAGIGGDGCKFRLRNQDFRDNGGRELKLHIGFVHEGEKDQVQIHGGYYVELHKDGAHVSDVDHNTRGGANVYEGPQGKKYHYTKTVPLNLVPGGSANGNYTIWVKDGSNERDSQNFTFTVSGGNGEVWLIFAQNN